MGTLLLTTHVLGAPAHSRLQEVLSSDPDTPLLGASGERILQEPPGGIGLQAWRLEVATDQLTGSSPAVFEAGTPWWRC